MSEPSPVVYQGTPEVSGFYIARASATTFTVSSGTLLDNNLINTYSIPTATTVSILNDIDTGAVVASTLYGVFVIGNYFGNKPVRLIISAETTPAFPPGYDMCRRIGWVSINAASEVEPMYQFGTGDLRIYSYVTPPLIGAAFGSDQPNTPIDLSAFIPPMSTRCMFTVFATMGAPGAGSNVHPPGGSQDYAGINTQVVGVMQRSQLMCPCGVVSGKAQIQYQVVDFAFDLYALSFEDYL
jgi:hypothetical protein